jgi:hypothetical protein
MNDFDFLVGKWDITSRRQDKWLVGSTNYEEFTHSMQAWTHFDGKVSFDVGHFPSRGFSGLALRLQNPDTGDWSIYWVDSRTMRMDPPVVGRFVDGVGTFIGDDTYEGRPIKVRFTWSDITPTSARWQQELSDDDGQTWELNWVMQMTRA